MRDLTVQEKVDIGIRFAVRPDDPGTLRHKTRPPHMFDARDPERMAQGWNRKFAGQPAAVSPNGQVKVNGKYLNARKVLIAAGGVPDERKPKPRGLKRDPLNPIPTRRDGIVPHCDLSPDVIREVFKHDATTGLIMWQVRQHPYHTGLLEQAENAAVNRGREAGEISRWGPAGVAIFNRRNGDRPVSLPRDGIIRIGNYIRVPVEAIQDALGIDRIVRPIAKPRKAGPTLPDSVIRRIAYAHPKGPVWAERDASLWGLLVLAGAYAKVPDAIYIERWNAEHADQIIGRDLPPASPIVIGKVRMSRKRIAQIVATGETKP